MVYAGVRGFRRVSVLFVMSLGLLAASLSTYASDLDALGAVTADISKSPRAHAGPGQTVVIGQRVVLDATSSINPAGNTLRYAWTLNAPRGSGARLDDATSPRPSFVVDLIGDYSATVIVGNEKYRSAVAQVAISTGNVPPLPNAGPDQHVAVGQVVALDARNSSDVNGDALSYVWSVQDAPVGSRAAIASARNTLATFSPDAPGNYVLELLATDGHQRNAIDTVVLSTVDAPANVDAGDDLKAALGHTVQLDARGSKDPEAQALTFRWSLIHAPVGSSAVLLNTHDPRPQLRPDVAGLYVAQVAVSDGRHPDAYDTVVIDAQRAATMGGQQARGGLDTDGDGVPDDVDNCAENFNPTQLDSNGDGFGNRCDADLDNDGFITNFGDLGLLRLAFFSNPASDNWNPDADFNEDGIINFVDLGIMRSFFFGPPGPIALTFINPAGGSWHDAANWSPPVVPTTVHTVRIDLDPGAVVEYSTGSSEIAGIRTTSPLRISGGTLSVAGNAQFNADMTMAGGTLANANILASVAQPAPLVRVEGGTSSSFDSVTLAAMMEIEGGATIDVDGGLTLNGARIELASDNNFTQLRFAGANGGSSTLGGVGEIVFGGTTTIDNRNRVVNLGNNHALIVEPGVLIRNGTAGGEVLASGSGSALTIQGIVQSTLPDRLVTLSGTPLTIDGTLDIFNGGLLRANFNNTGGSIGAGATVMLDTGELELRGDFTSAADMVIANGTLDLGSSLDHMWVNAGSIALANGTLEAGGSYDAAAVGTMTGTGQSFIDGAFDNTAQMLDVATLLPGTVSLATGGSIIGGSIITTPLVLPGGESFELDGVTLSTDLLIEPSSTMRIRNGLSLDGATVTLDSDNNFTTLQFVGANFEVVTLGGAGEVVFAGTTNIDNRNRITAANTGMNLIVESGVTVRSLTTGGQIALGSSSQSLIMRGTVVSDITDRLITLSGTPIVMEGTLSVINDARLQLDFNGDGGTIAATASVTVDTGELELFGNFENFGTINIVDSVIDLGNNVAHMWVNSGTIVLTNSTLELGGTFTLADAGSITGSGSAILNGTLINTGESFDVNSVLGGNIDLVTGGTIVGGSVVGAPVNIGASQQFTLDGVLLQSDMDINSGATVRIENDLTLNGATINLLSNNGFTQLSFIGGAGDLSRLAGTGEVVFGGTTTIDNRNRVISGSADLTIESGVTMRTGTAGGQVRSSSASAVLTIQGSVIANVSGRELALSGTPLVFEGDFAVSNDALGEAAFGSTTGVIAATGTMSVDTGELELLGDFTNNGAITIANGVLDIGNAVADEWTNAGTIALTMSTVELGGAFTFADIGNITGGDTIVIDGLLDNTGQTLDLNGDLPGTTVLGLGGTILNGSIVGSDIELLEFQNFTLDGVTLAANLNLQRGSTMDVDNSLTLSGATITMTSDNNFTSLRFNGGNGDTSMLTGTGDVVFAGTTSISNRNRVLGSGTGHTFIMDTDITLRSDTIGGELRHLSANGPLIMRGSVVSNVSGGDISLLGRPLTIEGDVTVTNNARALLNFDGVGSSTTATSSLSANTGEIAVIGDVTLGGNISVTDGLLDIGNAVGDEWTNAGTIALTNSTVELGGVLSTAAFGTITGTGSSLINGVYDLTGQTVDLGALMPGPITLASDAVLVGGQLMTTSITAMGSPTLDGMTLGSDLTIAPGAAVTVENGLTLASANVIMASDNNFSSLRFTGANGGTSIFGGTGEVHYAGTASVDNRNRVQGSGVGHTLTIDTGITLRTVTSGGELRHINNGVINMNGTAISNLPGRTLTLRAGPLNLGGTLNLGAGGKADLFEYIMDAGTVVNLDIGGTANNEFGRWSGTNDQLGGTLNVSLVNGFTPSGGDAFLIGDLASDNGVFDTVNLPALGGGLSFQTVYNPSDVTLEVN